VSRGRESETGIERKKEGVRWRKRGWSEKEE